MVLDYHERKQVSKNRPKKRPLKFIFVLTAVSVAAIYSLGVATGWFLYKAKKAATAALPANVAAADGKKTGEGVPPAVNRQNAPNDNNKISDPPLTFYDTLPKGEVTALGSGLNPAPVNRRPETANTKKDSGNSTTANQKSEQQRQNASSGLNNDRHDQSTDSNGAKNSPGTDKADRTSSSNKPVASSKTYTVQAASCTVKKEAEAVKEALDRKGLLSYVVESKVPGKGTWYRVRLGNHLDLETAGRIAARVGNNAIVIPE